MYRPKHRAPIRRRPTLTHARPGRGRGGRAGAGCGPRPVGVRRTPTAHFSHQPAPRHSRPSQAGQAGQAGQTGQARGRRRQRRRASTTRPRPTAASRCRATPGCRLVDLKPTAQPVTPYEMPFPCGEVWTGSTRSGHSPSSRAVDFNYSGGDLGKPVVAAAPGTVVTAVVGKNKPQLRPVRRRRPRQRREHPLRPPRLGAGHRRPGRRSRAPQLGTVGNTGNSSGAHLHFEERVGGAVVDSWFHGARVPDGLRAGLAELRHRSRSPTSRWPATCTAAGPPR